MNPGQLVLAMAVVAAASWPIHAILCALAIRLHHGQQPLPFEESGEYLRRSAVAGAGLALATPLLFFLFASQDRFTFAWQAFVGLILVSPVGGQYCNWVFGLDDWIQGFGIWILYSFLIVAVLAPVWPLAAAGWLALSGTVAQP